MTRTGRFADLIEEEPFPGVHRRSFDTEKATFTRYRFAPGAAFPPHEHPEEQTVVVEAGAVRFTVAGHTAHLAEGDWATVEPSVEHSLVAGSQGASALVVVIPARASSSAYRLT